MSAESDGEAGQKKKASVGPMLAASLVAVVALGAFIYNQVTTATRKALADQAASADRARDEAASQAASNQEVRLTGVLVAFNQAAKAGDFDPLLAMAARPYRDGMDARAFGRAVAANPYLKMGGTLVPHRTSFRSGAARWEGTLTTEMGPLTYEADFAGEPAGWRLSGLEVGGVQVLPAPPPAK